MDLGSIKDNLKSSIFGNGWRDLLKPASFRGVPFYVSGTETGIGRRSIVHQYPFRSIPYVEDMGMEADEFTINGYVISNRANDYNYFNARDALINALQEKGSGTLIHPYLNEKQVSLIGKARLTETFEEGGIARFTMTFVLAGVNRYASVEEDWVSELDLTVEDAENAIIDSFGSNWFADNLPDFSIQRLATTVRKCYAAQRRLMTAIQGGPRSLISSALGYVDSSAAKLFDSTMTNACDLAGNILSSFNSFKNLGGVVGDFQDNILTGICSNVITKREGGVNKSTTAKPNQIDQTLGISMIIQFASILMVKDEITLPIVQSPTTARESANQELLGDMIVNLGMTAATQVAARIDYVSQDDAMLVLDTLNEVIDAQLDSMGDNANYSTYINYGIDIQTDDSYAAMQDLRQTFTKSMMGLAADLPQMENYNVKDGSMPALVLAYSKYKNIDREQDILNRNKILIPHPAFMPGGETIKILSY
jgi:prophage DNA circulation protein